MKDTSERSTLFSTLIRSSYHALALQLFPCRVFTCVLVKQTQSRCHLRQQVASMAEAGLALSLRSAVLPARRTSLLFSPLLRRNHDLLDLRRSLLRCPSGVSRTLSSSLYWKLPSVDRSFSFDCSPPIVWVPYLFHLRSYHKAWFLSTESLTDRGSWK